MYKKVTHSLYQLYIIIFFSVLLYYMVPSALYCLYNNLAFVNLASYDPTTYFLLLQFRVVLTGVIFQVSSCFSTGKKNYKYSSLEINMKKYEDDIFNNETTVYQRQNYVE